MKQFKGFICFCLILVLLFALTACGSTPPEKKHASETATTETAVETQPTPETPATDGIRPELRDALAEYEAFFDSYCEFMKKYADSKDAVSMLSDYATFLSRYSEMMDKMDKLGKEEMNQQELAYYLEVTARIQKKLASVAAQ